MIGYVTLGTDDLARAIAFYDSVLAKIGAKRFDTSERSAYWQAPRDGHARPLHAVFTCENDGAAPG
jgi:catechol 2,3-dioxygenase-like lactoylglutathione lyase family enzyme